jgi:hypothetical protein
MARVTRSLPFLGARSIWSRSDGHVGLQALPLHQFDYLLSYLRQTSIASQCAI